LPPLAWEAARELSARDYALLDLNVRKGLSPAELAPVLGVSARQAGQIVQRMRKAAATVLGGYMVARRCRNCEDLRHLLAGFEFPPYGDDVRQAVDAHIATCEACSAEFRALGDPLAAFAALTPLPVPLALKADTWRDVAAMWPVRDRAQPLAVGAVPTSPDFGAPPAFAGFGGRGDGGGADGSVLLGPSDDSGNRLLLFAVAVLGLVVFAFAVAAGVLIAGGIGDDDDGGVAGDATATVTGTPASTRTVGVNVETSTPEPVTDTPVPPPTDTPAPATATPPPLPTDTPPPPPTAGPTEDEDATPTPEEDGAEATPTP
jgi:hypothetical protein